MKISLILFPVLALVAWATPLQQVSAEVSQPERGIHRRAPNAQTKPPDKPDPCDKCDRVYFDCIFHSEYCRNHNVQECQLNCRIEACDYQDCYRNCGWTDCTHKKTLEAQQGGVQQGEAPQASTVKERSPVANESAQQQEAEEKTTTQQETNTDISSQHDADIVNHNVVIRAGPQLGSTDILSRWIHAVESRADCNSCKDHYNQCLDKCGAWWSPGSRPQQCYGYCEVDTCKFQDCKKKCLTWSNQC